MVNYLAILACGIAAMIIGSIWYGPLFGKFWMTAVGADNCTPEEKEKMKKGMGFMYFIQFVLALITAWALNLMILHWALSASAIKVAVFAWVGFVFTAEAGAALWSGKSKSLSWKMFLVSASSALVTFIVYALILGGWK